MRSILLIVGALLFVSQFSFSQVIKGTYAIKNSQTGMVLRIKDANKANGTPLVAYTPVNWKCVTWDFQHVEGQTYQLKNLFTGKTFEFKDSAAVNDMTLEQQPLAAKKAKQLYEFVPVEHNNYLIKLKDRDLYLTPSGEKESVNSAVILTRKRPGNLQYWTLHEQHPDF